MRRKILFIFLTAGILGTGLLVSTVRTSDALPSCGICTGEFCRRSSGDSTCQSGCNGSFCFCAETSVCAGI